MSISNPIDIFIANAIAQISIHGLTRAAAQATRESMTLEEMVSFVTKISLSKKRIASIRKNGGGDDVVRGLQHRHASDFLSPRMKRSQIEWVQRHFQMYHHA